MDNNFLFFFWYEMSDSEQHAKVFTVNKFVDEVKKVYPGAKTINVIVHALYVKQSKVMTYFTAPLAIIIDKLRFTNEEFSTKLGVESILIGIKDSHHFKITNNPDCMIWAIVIKCEEQKEFKEFKYYPSTLQMVKNQAFINLIMPCEEFDANYLLDEEH